MPPCMALARLSVKVGHRGKAGPHAAYIARTGRYASRLERSEERLAGSASGNLPAWAGGNPAVFWRASDAFERANGTAYREMELALPRELNDSARRELVREFVAAELGQRHAYQWAIHVPKASDGLEQPHAHLMFSERQVDGIGRDPEQYFRRYNKQAPEKGGARKQFGTATKPAERKAELKALRTRWEVAVNVALEDAGVEARIDMRSLRDQAAAQGLDGDLVPVAETRTLPSEWHREGGAEATQARRSGRASSSEAIAERVAEVVRVRDFDAAEVRAAREARGAAGAVQSEAAAAAAMAAVAAAEKERRVAEQRAAEQRAAEQRAAERRDAERQAAEQRAEATRQAERAAAERREAEQQREAARRAEQVRQETARRERDAHERTRAVEAEREAKAAALKGLEAAVIEYVDRLTEGAMAPERERCRQTMLEAGLSPTSAWVQGTAEAVSQVGKRLRSQGQAPSWQEREQMARLELGMLAQRRATLGEPLQRWALENEAERDEGLIRARSAEQYLVDRERDYARIRDKNAREAARWAKAHPIRCLMGLTKPHKALLARSASAERTRQKESPMRVEAERHRKAVQARVYGALEGEQAVLAETLGEIGARRVVLGRRIEAVVPVEEKERRAATEREARAEQQRKARQSLPRVLRGPEPSSRDDGLGL